MRVEYGAVTAQDLQGYAVESKSEGLFLIQKFDQRFGCLRKRETKDSNFVGVKALSDHHPIYFGSSETAGTSGVLSQSMPSLPNPEEFGSLKPSSILYNGPF